MILIDREALCQDLLDRWSVADEKEEEEIQNVMADVVTPIVFSQPTIEMPSWIPCSERLPEESVPVLVCFTDWQTQEKTIDVSCLRDRNLWDDHGRYNKECVAWMPLPEPYSIKSDGIGGEQNETN